MTASRYCVQAYIYNRKRQATIRAHTARREGEIRIMVRRQRVSGGRSQRSEIPGRESSGCGDANVRRRNQRSPCAEDTDRTSGHQTAGSVLIRMERRIIRRRPAAATENQRFPGRKRTGPGGVRAQKT